MRKKLLFLSLILFASFLLVSCNKKEEKAKEKEQSDYYVYYLNGEENQIVSISFTPTKRKTTSLVEEFIKELSHVPDGTDYEAPIMHQDMFLKYTLEKRQLVLYFNEIYTDMDVTREVLSRAAIVRTLTQIQGIDCVYFYVGDFPLKDSNDKFVGMMTADTFVENVGRQINTIVAQKITLYLPSKDGTGLRKIEKEVYASSNYSAEKLILKHLKEGEEGYKSVIPKGTKLISVSTLDGVCFVNFDSGFMAQDYTVTEEVIIYSIVDSLCELPNINKVQILINGKNDIIYRESFNLQELYERNLDLIVTDEEEDEEVEGEE